MSRPTRAAVALATVALTLQAPARAQPDPAADSARAAVWSPQVGADEVQKPLTATEEARATFERAAREGEEARLARSLGVYYLRTEGLRSVRVRCTPLCGVTRIRVGADSGAPTAASLQQALRTIDPILVGASPAIGLGAPPEKGLVTWFPRRVHPRFPCDCAVGVIVVPDAGTFFESLEGAEQLPNDVRYTRGEARDAALRQLVVRDPRSDGEPAEPVLVVSAGNRARLVHRFLLRLDGSHTRSTSTTRHSRS